MLRKKIKELKKVVELFEKEFEETQDPRKARTLQIELNMARKKLYRTQKEYNDLYNDIYK